MLAWIDRPGGGHDTVRAAYRTPAGRWSAIRADGRTTPFVYAYPRLRRRDRRPRLQRGHARCRRRGRRLADPGPRVRCAERGSRRTSLRADARDDADGAATLVATARCDDESQSHGLLLAAPAAKHGVGKPLAITPRPATEVRLVPTGPRTVVASWPASDWRTSELLNGPVEAERISRSGATSTVDVPAGLDDDLGRIAAQGGAELVWETYTTGAPRIASGVARVGASGTVIEPAAGAPGIASGSHAWRGGTVIEPAAGAPRSPPRRTRGRERRR